MNAHIKDLLKKLIRSNCIGGKHVPEDLVLKQSCRSSNKRELKEFKSAYGDLVKQGFIMRLKKRTGRGFDYHISIDPSRFDELEQLIEDDDYVW